MTQAEGRTREGFSKAAPGEQAPSPLRVFVLADTHDRLPQNVKTPAAGADEIWHLGDVCAPEILAELEAVGPPVTLVRGNCDSMREWPLVLDLVRHGVRFRLVHIPPREVVLNADVVLHGHTHVPRDEVRDRVRFLNPGCVTRPNRGALASAALLEILSDGTLRWQLLPLR